MHLPFCINSHTRTLLHVRVQAMLDLVASRDYGSTVIECGGVTAVETALQCFPTSPRLLHSASALLLALFRTCGSRPELFAVLSACVPTLSDVMARTCAAHGVEAPVQPPEEMRDLPPLGGVEEGVAVDAISAAALVVAALSSPPRSSSSPSSM